MIRVRVENITSNSGETIALPESGVICIVGGNNAGKSQLLREIEKQLDEHGENVPIVLQHVSVDKPELGIEEAEAFLPLFPKQRSVPGTTAQYHSLSSPVVHSAEEFVRMFNLFGDSVFQ
jgi:ABC-type cobalamin/Fe3+-siderophores transport system ATPase subunit